MYKTIKWESQKDITLNDEKAILKEHAKALSFFMYLFAGAVVSFSLWYAFLPMPLTNLLFHIQTKTITDLNQKVVGNLASVGLLGKIFLNNLKVLVFCIIFAFLYGAGAIFILIWNASVVGVAIGNFIRTNLAKYADSIGAKYFASYFYVISIGLLKYTIHGIPEILAYFIAGLAGGLISVATINYKFGSKYFEKIVLDSSDLVLIAILMLVVAAFLEVYVTPAIFAGF
jgi:uncharacterized membrane protein SpoIIM required for sporulation